MSPSYTMDEAFDLLELRRRLAAVLATLTVRERLVVRRHYGLDGNPWTLAEVASEMWREDGGDSMGLSAGRTQQIEAKAIRKLRHPSRAQFIEAFS